jgi:EmrB/QacA subfamily drug resistance transporter
MTQPTTSGPPPSHSSFLATRGGKVTLALLCAVAFLDYLDTSIVNVALPSIAHDLRFSVQNLQWVLSGYVVTYGGFLLLGGRLADLLGRRRTLVAGTALFALASLAGGLAPNAGTLVGARLVQGVGAAVMTPSGLSLLTTSFSYGTDRVRALGAWGAMAGLASVLGVFLGGVLSAGPGWRWVLFVNLPVCAAVLATVYRVVPADATPPFGIRDFDLTGGLLGTGGMLLLIFGLVRAPDDGWSSARTIGELATAAALLALLALNEARAARPLIPAAIFRVHGLIAADGSQVFGMAGFYSVFFFVTLYMQDVLGYSPFRAGVAYVPVAVMVGAAAGLGSGLITRIGTRPLIVAGALVAAGGIFWLSMIGVQGHYLTDLLPGFLIMSFGLGNVFVGVQTAANAGVPPSLAGLAGAMITASFQVGGALGLAVFSAVATSRTSALLAEGAARATALTAGFHRALLLASIFVLAAAVVGLRAANTRGEPASEVTGMADGEPLPDAVRLRVEQDPG